MAESHATHRHPSPKQYIRIAIALAVLTAIEVSLFYINNTLRLGWINTAALLILAFLKFVIVIGWYMHLRFERAAASRFFTFGFVLAFSVYGIVLVTFGVLALRA
jgi:cytochrome c oxidase subunit 4